MKIRIDIATREDFQTIIDLLKKLYLELGEEKESIEFLNLSLMEEVTKKGTTLILKAIGKSDEIIGILALSETQAIYAGGSYGIINDMYINPSFRSQNIGKMLIEKVKRIAHEKYWKRIEVTAPTNENEKTVRFYKNNGFVFTGPKMKLKI